MAYKLYKADAELVLSNVYLALKDPAEAKALAKSAHQKAKDMAYRIREKESAQLLREIVEIE